DSFFMLGGNSLLAVRLVSRLRSAGYTLGLQDIFASPCLVDMAKNVRDDDINNLLIRDEALIVKLEGNDSPVFFVPSGFGDYSYVYGLSKTMDIDSPIYALPWPERMAEAKLSMKELVHYMVNTLLRVQPEGVYSIIGYSSGGVLAWLIADYLLCIGKQVKFIGMIDTLSPLAPKNESMNFDLDNADYLINKENVKHYAQIVRQAEIRPIDVNIYLFKALLEEDNDLEYIKQIRCLGYSRERNQAALLWDIIPGVDNINVLSVNGNHSSILSDAQFRKQLADKISRVLKGDVVK
ncbi:thioesterase domain-containing protein, partial [Acinetobacter sp. A47]|uniref:thioesterase domain-containing protein n=1 Tax=Acinetobacter sp. A47 TaxID=1561217 RepID=UPI0005716C54